MQLEVTWSSNTIEEKNKCYEHSKLKQEILSIQSIKDAEKLGFKTSTRKIK